MTESKWHLFLCNGAEDDANAAGPIIRTVKLDYSGLQTVPNVSFKVHDFVRQLQHVPDRALDLLELAAYIYCADRSVFRGGKSDIVYNNWTQNIAIYMKVRDWPFWSRTDVQEALVEALNFMAGHNFRFVFQPGHRTPAASLFDRADLPRDVAKGQIVLFSGGVDSLAGICQALAEGDGLLYLVSHRSQNTTYRTQNALHQALKRHNPEASLSHITFTCNLKGTRAREETQRTRFFLYAAVAYAASAALDIGSFHVFENGITSLNLAKSQQLMNARNSRTTHPRTIEAMRRFLRLVNDGEYQLHNPFRWMTKGEVIAKLVELGQGDLLSSSVSCSRTFDEGVKGARTHCGRCSQCIDRRMAVYAAGHEDFDNESLYVRNLICQSVEQAEAKTTLVDYIRQAVDFTSVGTDGFYERWLDELTDIIPAVSQDEQEGLEQVYGLCQRHGQGVLKAIRRMHARYEDLTQPIAKDSLLEIVSNREYLTEPVRLMARRLEEILRDAIPLAFQHGRPKNEANLQDIVNSVLASHRIGFESEYPYIRFALATSKPDQSIVGTKLLIETKYIRLGTSPSKITEGISADLIKYSEGAYTLFIVYDPDHTITRDDVFKRDLETKGNCTISIIR
jgi:7-cyano-7-deazaguanine synthase in queuosine biosynthesis